MGRGALAVSAPLRASVPLLSRRRPAKIRCRTRTRAPAHRGACAKHCGMRSFQSRIHPRWSRYDYRLPGLYFVTTITLDRVPMLGALCRGECVLSPFGLIVHRTLQQIPQRFPGVELDAFIVMPDHVHALIGILEQPAATGTPRTSLSDVVCWAKSRSAHEINVMRETPGNRIWQTSFHDSIVRTPDGRDRIRRYIELNPRRG